jgi:hypothetical protein
MCRSREVYLECIREEPDIVEKFIAATRRPPWSMFPEEERINFLRDLLEPLLRLAMPEGDERKLCDRTLRIAASHGEHRRAQGLGEDILFEDIDLFGRAVLSQLSELDPEVLESEAYGRVDGVLSLACMASLRGYHRQTFEEMGRWPNTLEELRRTRHTYFRAA